MTAFHSRKFQAAEMSYANSLVMYDVMFFIDQWDKKKISVNLKSTLNGCYILVFIFSHVNSHFKHGSDGSRSRQRNPPQNADDGYRT